MSVRATEATGVMPAGSSNPTAPLNVKVALFGVTNSVISQFVRYAIVGGVAFGIDAVSLYLLVELAHVDYLISAGIGFSIGLITNYCISRLWVFDRRVIKNVALEFAIFTAVGLVGLGMNEFLIWFVHEKIHLHFMIGKVISAGIILVWNFGARKLLLFR
jgi:putative flippase GtrA